MPKKQKEILTQIGLHVFLILILLVVMFPIVWIVSLAIDPRNIDKPLELTLIPPGASLASFRRVLLEPWGLLCRNPNDPSSCMTFLLLLKNSLIVALAPASSPYCWAPARPMPSPALTLWGARRACWPL